MKQTRRDFLQKASLGVVAAGAATRAPADTRRRKPNIIFIMSDELGYYELSCMGSKTIQTPNIDRLASQGILFTQGLAGSAVCAPTRACLMTGKHSGHTSVRTNGGGTPLRKGEETVASVLKNVGYATGGFGKWGCGGRGSTGVPEEHGFDVFLGYYDQVHAHTYYPPYIVRNSKEIPLPGNQGGGEGEIYSHYAIVEEAEKFIKSNKDRPFFCYLPITPPHGIFCIPENDPAWKLYRDKPWPGNAAVYAAMVSMVDRQVGDIVDLVRELGLDKDTIIFFCGDNGGNDYFRDKDHPRGFHNANVNPETGKEFRGKKGRLYEGGLRIPMIAYWPDRIQAGRTSDHLWYFPDFLATAAELAGTSPPTDSDGISIVPELLGASAAGREQKKHDYLYWELGSQTAVRMNNWKAIKPRKEDTWELYDLDSDIEEKNDISDRHPDILAKMKKLAEEAHEPAREGIFHNREIHEKDRRAKHGGKRRAQRGKKPNTLPREGLVPREAMKIAGFSSEAGANGRKAAHAIDGEPTTHWHSNYADGPLPHPHELTIDLGSKRVIRGFRYLCRQDGGWNGAIKDCEFYVGDNPENLTELAVKASFSKTKKPQETKCDPVEGRYVLLRTLSEVNDGPWASVSEIGVIGK